MTFKSNLTPLNGLELLDLQVIELLRKSGITTLEEFVGILESDPEGARELLDLNESELFELREQAISLLNPKVQAAFAAQKGKKFPLGALDPSLRCHKQ
jgi:hypothetical protein